MSRRLGLIIGTNQYQDPTFRQLQFAENDARALAQWLVNAQGGKWAPSDVQHVQGSHATKTLIESLIKQMCIDIAEPDDLVFIYFAGHAFVDENSGEGYLALANTTYQNPATGLHLNSFVQQIIARSRAGHMLLILDCFQTGKIWSMRRSSAFDFTPALGPILLNTLQQQNNRFFLCSCRGNELSPEVGEKKLGLLAYRMIIGLSGQGNGSATESITLQQLSSYLFSTLGEQQRPQIFGQERSPFILVGNTLSISDPRQTSSPDNPSSMAAASTAYGQSGSTATAQSIATEPRFSPAGDPPLQQAKLMLNQARKLLQEQKYPEAFTIVEQVLQVIPNDVEALILKAQILHTGGRIQEAMVVVEQLIHIDANNTMGWNMRAVLLGNVGQYQVALTAIERSLALDNNNPETRAIKQNIVANLPATQNQTTKGSQQHEKPQGSTHTFFIAFALQVLAFILGAIGAALLITQPHLSSTVGIALMSLGLAILCINAAHTTYHYGRLHIISTLLMSLVAGAVLIALYKFGYTKISAAVNVRPQLLVPVLFLAAWLAAATIVPLLAAIGGLISRFLIARKHTG